MKFVLEPIKNQQFEIGRTINLSKCNCEKCDYMNCPKNNYALKMKKKQYSVEDFFNEYKVQLISKKSLYDFFDYDMFSDFIDACVGNFPRGTYWNSEYDHTIELVSRNRSKYGPDFNTRCEICFNNFGEDFIKLTFFNGCTDTQEKFARNLKQKFMKLNELLSKELRG